MKHHPYLTTTAALAALAFGIAPARATIVQADSADTYVEARWVQADSASVTVDARDYTNLTLTSENGTVNGLRTGLYPYPPNTQLELTPAPDIGHLFNRWEGAATGNSNPLSLTLDFDKALTARFIRDGRDPDADDLTNYDEIITHGTNPDLWDTDDDGFGDGYEVNSGFDPKSGTNSPDTQMAIYTAVEVEFGAGLGKTYRVESSTDLQTWTLVESGIPGTGGTITRLYSIRAIPRRYFRAVKE
jgi:hypothetical protein